MREKASQLYTQFKSLFKVTGSGNIKVFMSRAKYHRLSNQMPCLRTFKIHVYMILFNGDHVMRTFASHQCGPGRRHMRVEFVVSSLLSSERFFSGYPSFLLSPKTFPNSNSIWNARTRFNEVFSTPKCFVGKQITLEMTNSSSYNHVCYRILCGPVTLYSFK